MDTDQKQTLALAAVVQSGFLVHQLAQHGLAAQDKIVPLIRSLFELNPGAVSDIYGGAGKLRLGLQLIVEIIEDGTDSPANAETVRYLLSLLYLQHKLQADSRMMNRIRESLETIGTRFPPEQRTDDTALVEALAGIYQENISKLGRRIQVRGDMRFLENPHVAAKVRVVLFAGIRAGVLWHQLGGRRWQLLFGRKRILRAARQLLSTPQL